MPRHVSELFGSDQNHRSDSSAQHFGSLKLSGTFGVSQVRKNSRWTTSKNNMKRFLLLFLLPIIVACDHGTEWRDGNYEVGWIDSHRLTLNFSLGNGSSIGRVGGEVIAVGSNENFVVAKQRNSTTKKISFFFIEKKRDDPYKNAEEITQGPYSEAEFLDLSRQLGFPSFTKQFHY